MATTRRELERTYQKKVIDKIKDLLPGCIALKNDSSYIQGFPDWTILYGNRWAVLEIKRSIDAIHQPNQDYYIDILNDMGYASFIFPENEEDVLIELYSALQS